MSFFVICHFLLLSEISESRFSKIDRIFELKDLRHGPNGLICAYFLDTFFLFLIYTEVGAVIRTCQGCFSESGRDKGDSLMSLSSYLFIYPRQQNEFS